jgi:protein-S-isoprenylcysteine O-methyltransferase Ste14
MFAGETILALAHRHLSLNFNSLVAVRSGQSLIETGPYRFIRHPIYTAYFISYIAGGLLSANWVLTFIPAPLFAAMIALRVGEEEKVMIETFGEAYLAYMRHTGRFLPRLGLHPGKSA